MTPIVGTSTSTVECRHLNSSVGTYPVPSTVGTELLQQYRHICNYAQYLYEWIRTWKAKTRAQRHFQPDPRKNLVLGRRSRTLLYIFLQLHCFTIEHFVICFSYHAVASIQFGIPYTYLMFSYTRKMQDKKKKFRAAVKVKFSDSLNLEVLRIRIRDPVPF